MRLHQVSNIFTSVAKIFGLLLVLACVSATSSAYAEDGASNARQAATQAIEKNGGSGEVLSVSKEISSSGKLVFAVKIIKNGRVRVIRIPQS